jgi:hypothetical protein
MKKNLKRLGLTLALILVAWTVLTFWVESKGPARSVELGGSQNGQRALIVYDPDPFYNLDQQVCEAFGQSLANNGWKVMVATVTAVNKKQTDHFDLYVFCANTYNWSPDWSVRDFIIDNQSLDKKNIVAITLGAGTTGRSKRILESLIKDKHANLIDSRAFWLWRPNDESAIQESNVVMAVNLTKEWADTISKQIKKN